MTNPHPPGLPHDFRPAGPLVNLQIEQLVLHGFPPRDRDRIVRALQRELAQLITVQGIPTSLTQNASFEHIDAGEFQHAASSRAEAAGIHVAQSVYRGLSQ